MVFCPGRTWPRSHEPFQTTVLELRPASASWHPEFSGADIQVAASIAPPGGGAFPIDLYLGYYARPRPGHSMTAHLNQLLGGQGLDAGRHQQCHGQLRGRYRPVSGVDRYVPDGKGGKGGRLTKGDALAAAQKREAAPEPSSAPAAAAGERADEKPASQSGNERFTRKKMSPLRRKIAAQLVMAQHTAAILTTFNECDMTEVQNLRPCHRTASRKRTGSSSASCPSSSQAAVEGLSAALPINGRITGTATISSKITTTTSASPSGPERGLVVPVVRDADQKLFADIRVRPPGLRRQSRERQNQDRDLAGGAFRSLAGPTALPRHAYLESAPKRDSRHARDSKAAGRD